MWSTLYTVAKDVKFQVEFNKDLVKGYRLVGYENREMAAEDFANDKKDGGEVGSGQTVTVLYEIVPADSDYQIPQVDSRYGNDKTEASNDTQKAETAADELLAVNIRYKEPDSNTSELRTYPVTKDMISDTMDDDTSWAAGVAQFGMLLRESEFAGTSTYEDIIDRLKQDPKVMTDDFRAEFLYIAEKVAQDN
jgi:Ca-activated chloride channel family protein